MDIKKEFERIEKQYARSPRGTDFYKWEFVEQLDDPLDLCRVIVEWSDMIGDDYYSAFRYSILGAAHNILKKRGE